MKLYPDRVKDAFKEFSKEAKMDEIELAEGIIKVANSNMERAIRVISIERGYDPSQFSLFSFGGAGGLHAAELAKSLGIPRVIIPKNSGILSAFGMLMADVIKDYSTTVMLQAKESEYKHLEELFSIFEKRAVSDMEKEPVKEILFEKFLDMRYKGQSYEITVPFSKDFIESFHSLHEKKYGYKDEEKPVEIVNIRLKAIGITEKPEIVPVKEKRELSEESVLRKRRIIWNGKEYECYVVDRDKLHYGNSIPSPSIIVEYSSTTFIPPFSNAYVDEYNNLIIEIE